MGRKTREQLKEVFVNGSTPDENDFGNLFDSFKHQSDPAGSVALASQPEAEGGDDNSKIMTPLRVKQAITALTRLSSLIDLNADVNSSIQTAIDDLINSAPGMLNTLGEIATALQSNDSEIAALLGAINNRYTKRELDAFFEGVSGGKKQVSWESLTEKPAHFTPSTHTHTFNDVGISKSSRVDLDDTDRLATSRAVYIAYQEGRKWANLTGKPGAFPPAAHTHTPSQVGLGNLPNARSDSTASSSSNVLATSRAVRDARDYARKWNNLLNKPEAVDNIVTGIRFRRISADRYKFDYFKNGIWITFSPRTKNVITTTEETPESITPQGLPPTDPNEE